MQLFLSPFLFDVEIVIILSGCDVTEVTEVTEFTVTGLGDAAAAAAAAGWKFSVFSRHQLLLL